MNDVHELVVQQANLVAAVRQLVVLAQTPTAAVVRARLVAFGGHR